MAASLPSTLDDAATAVSTNVIAAGMSTHDALSKVTAAISAAAQEMQQQKDGDVGANEVQGPCKAWTGEELTDAVEVC